MMDVKFMGRISPKKANGQLIKARSGWPLLFTKATYILFGGYGSATGDGDRNRRLTAGRIQRPSCGE